MALRAALRDRATLAEERSRLLPKPRLTNNPNSTMEANRTVVYRNAMESLVLEEVEAQFQKIPPKIANSLNKEEVVAFALNRLPTLYATSEKGWQQQYIRGKQKLATQISMAVRQGMAAVYKDPLRLAVPLSPVDKEAAEKALKKINFLLERHDISWDNLVEAVEQALAKKPQRIQWWNRVRDRKRNYLM